MATALGSLREVAKQGHLSGGLCRSWKRCWAFGVRAQNEVYSCSGVDPLFITQTRSHLSTNFNDPSFFLLLLLLSNLPPFVPISQPVFQKVFFSLESGPLFPNIPFEEFLAYSFTLP